MCLYIAETWTMYVCRLSWRRDERSNDSAIILYKKALKVICKSLIRIPRYYSQVPTLIIDMIPLAVSEWAFPQLDCAHLFWKVRRRWWMVSWTADWCRRNQLDTCLQQ